MAAETITLDEELTAENRGEALSVLSELAILGDYNQANTQKGSCQGTNPAYCAQYNACWIEDRGNEVLVSF